jgi:acetyl esterase/lipase
MPVRKVLVLAMALAVAGTAGATGMTMATMATGATGATGATATATATATAPTAPTVAGSRIPAAMASRSPADRLVRAVAGRPMQQDTYAYGRDPRQRLDAYWATPGSGRQPGVLLLHGGYWLSGGKGTWRSFAMKLSALGYAVFAADYRLSQSQHWPAQRNDSLAALAYVKRHAARYHLDPNRVAVIGASSGGHLATMLGTYGAGRGRVRGVVALSPVNSPYLAYLDGAEPGAGAAKRKLRAAVVQLLGCAPRPESAACWNRVQDATLVNHVDSTDAPMLLMHSAGDFVPYEQSAALRDALIRDRIPVTLTKVPGSAHGAALLGDASVERAVIGWVHSVTR